MRPSIPASFLTRRSTTTTPYRSNLQRTPRRHQRNQSSKTSESPSSPESANAQNNTPSPDSPSPSTSTPSGTVASAPGASTPLVTNTNTGSNNASRSIRQVLEQSALGRLGRTYTRVQERRPYVTQVCSSVVVYLCGDLSAQLLFPSDSPSPASASDKLKEEEEARRSEDVTGGGGYDPWRTLRHLVVGVGSSIPAYKW